MKIAVIGLGKIGLPLAVQFATKGHDVLGVDIDQDTVDSVNAGKEPSPGEAHLADHLALLIPTGRLRATTAYADAVPDADVVVVVVPLVVDTSGEPDFARMDGATDDIGQHLTTGTLVLYETTLPVGTTRKRFGPALESVSGLAEGTDFHLAYSPERVLTGRVFEDLRKYPKLVGGLSDEGTRAAIDFYQRVLDFDDRPDLARGNGVWDLGTAEAAELAKLAETTYRDVNIALANQFATYAETAGIDVWQVIEAANSQPYSHIHRPGIAVGGHCIPVYPRLYVAQDPDATVVRAARSLNAAMPRHAVELLAALYGPLEGARVVVLGAAYRGGVKETAFSGVFPIVEELQERGASVTVHDPLFTAEELERLGLRPHSLGGPADAAVVHTDHESYRRLAPSDLPGVTAILDGRGILAGELWTECRVQVLGRPPQGGPAT
jgi:nucleotide sugar dehydrogenase